MDPCLPALDLFVLLPPPEPMPLAFPLDPSGSSFPSLQSSLSALVASLTTSLGSRQPHHSPLLTSFLHPGDGLKTDLASLRCIIAFHPPLRFIYRIRLPLEPAVAPPLCIYDAYSEEFYWAVQYISSGPRSPNLIPTSNPSPRSNPWRVF
ncbi:unnamed protein product [Arabis nemorensis]|uniref:Uncharacterized protein n=1 Tax=Arabis nemorensis TaxID=586526 RepID=A0A565BVS5_9BRAS|nr:unnamed protein product [Arabis nemorensis]